MLARAWLPMIGAAAFVVAMSGCDDHLLGVSEGVADNGPPPPVQPAEPALRRLTLPQYHNAIDDLFGEGLVLPAILEPDLEVAGLLSVGASVNAISPLGVERYEDAASLIAEQVVERPGVLSTVLGCAPAGPSDRECAEHFVTTFAERAWRRPLEPAEVSVLVNDVVMAVAGDAGDFTTGAQYGLMAMLQSPHFLYRTEHGDPGATGVRPLTEHELAARLSFLLWNTIPDEALLAAAEAGSLSTAEGVEVEVVRMLADPRARDGIRNFFSELLGLHHLADMSKDPTIFTHASPELAASAGEETLRVIERIVLDEDGDIRDLLTTRRTFVDRRLAALYDIPAPEAEGFAEVELGRKSGRRGLIGHASTLALHAHDTRSSATKRGAFLRTTLLCHEIPPPPPNVDTSIPEADATSPTLRQRIASHLEDPVCASCHQLMDPIGLALENFDGIGRWRDAENGAPIDASGDIDGVRYDDAWELAQVLRDHPDLDPCLTTHVYEYAVGHELGVGELELQQWLTGELAVSGHSFESLLVALATSDGFRNAGGVQ